MSKLSAFRRRLSRLRHWRQRFRWGTAYSAPVLAVLWILGAAFLVDWWLEMSQTQRMFCWAAGGGISIWAFCRFALPWLGTRETDLDMALLVERTEHIDSDLIAAVQFESPEACEWGSVQLEQAVIDRVAASGKWLHVMHGLSRRELSNRAILLVLTLVVWGVVAFRAPDHVATFFQRLAFGSQHYPTNTVIESIVVKTAEIDANDPEGPVDWAAGAGVTSQTIDPVHPGETKVLYGRRVRFEVRCSGVIPGKGKIEMTVTRNGLPKTLKLKRVAKSSVFAGELVRLREEHRYQLYLGDAWTDPGRLTVTQLPQVAVELEVVPPDYVTAATGAEPPKTPSGLRQVSVLEGSRVLIKLRSGKPLKRATVKLRMDGVESDAVKTLKMRAVKSDASAKPDTRWVLDAQGTWLSPVLHRVAFEVDVTDKADQQLDKPIEGVVRIKPDSPPRIAANIISPYVLPIAIPSVTFRATDDYGVARVSLLCEVTHADGMPEREKELTIYPVPDERQPPKPPRDTGSKRRYTLDLTPMGLKKGDQVKVTPKAVDYRGEQPGVAALGDPFVLRVTDEQGILHEMIIEGDQRSALWLDTMIQRELGIGGSP